MSFINVPYRILFLIIKKKIKLFRPTQCDQPCVQLIDFGRSIDMTLFPPDTTFTHTVKTADFICHEMREKLPWTYQVNICIAIFFFIIIVII